MKRTREAVIAELEWLITDSRTREPMDPYEMGCRWGMELAIQMLKETVERP